MRRTSLLSPQRLFVFCALAMAATGRSESNYVAKELYPLLGGGPLLGTDTAHVSAFEQTVGRGKDDSHPYLWAGMASPADLYPTQLTGLNFAAVLATDGAHQVGEGLGAATEINGYAYYHALFWSGTAASAVDLHPTTLSGWDGSNAVGVGGGQQVGAAFSPIGSNQVAHAMLWTGTPGSAVDLHPAGFRNSFARGTDGLHQVGDADNHAVLWSGTADSAVDLHPTKLLGFYGSHAYGVGGGQEVGYGEKPSTLFPDYHALLWSGTADSAVDLSPTDLSGFISSTAYSTNGRQQAGYGTLDDGANHALVWNGTADSAVDLHELLPSSFVQSYAFSIDTAGDIFGVASDANSNFSAVEWVPVPEPSFSLALIAIAGTMCPRRRWLK